MHDEASQVAWSHESPKHEFLDIRLFPEYRIHGTISVAVLRNVQTLEFVFRAVLNHRPYNVLPTQISDAKVFNFPTLSGMHRISKMIFLYSTEPLQVETERQKIGHLFDALSNYLGKYTSANRSALRKISNGGPRKRLGVVLRFTDDDSGMPIDRLVFLSSLVDCGTYLMSGRASSILLNMVVSNGFMKASKDGPRYDG